MDWRTKCGSVGFYYTLFEMRAVSNYAQRCTISRSNMKNVCIWLLALTIGLSSTIPISPFIGFITRKRLTTISMPKRNATLSVRPITTSPTTISATFSSTPSESHPITTPLTVTGFSKYNSPKSAITTEPARTILVTTSSTTIRKAVNDVTSTSTSCNAVVFVAQKSPPTAVKTQVRFEEATLLNIGDAFVLEESVFIAPKSCIYEFNFDGHKTGDTQSLNTSLRINEKDEGNTKCPISKKENQDWIPSAINEIIKRQNKRLSFLKDYDSKDQKEKIRTTAFKEQMDEEEIVHLECEIGKLQEIAELFHHAYPEASSESSSHSISKPQSINNFDAEVTNDAVSVINPKECSILIDELSPAYKPGDNRATTKISGTSNTAVTPIVFVAHNSLSTGVNTQVRFEKVTLNIGDAFDLKESAFIASKSGIYEFNFDGHKTGDHTQSLNISLRINGKDAVNTWSDYMGYHPGSGNHNFENLISLHSLLQLNKGDRIDLYKKQGYLLPGELANPKIDQPTQFTGKLLLEGMDWPTTSHINSNQQSPVYFNVKKNFSYCDPESPVPFEIININVGGAFNLKQQEFIIPVAGIYEFIVKGFKTGAHKEMEISLRHNKKRAANAWVDYVNIHEFHTSFSIYSILKAEKGDRIDLFLVKGCMYDDINHYTQFTGKLLMEYTNNNTPVDPVYFNVQKNASFTTSNATIPFELTVLNIGMAFNVNENLKEHMFTAPRSGIYEFNVAGVKESVSPNLIISLRLNRQPVTNVWVDFASGHGLFTPFSLHSILKVKKGDTIDLFNVGGGGSEIYDDTKRLTQFTGKLLHLVDNMV